MPTEIKGQPTSSEILARLAKEGRPVALSFSCGKDSIATWLALLDYGIEVVPCYFWLVPDLHFIAEELEYFEEVFDTRIHRLPNPAFYRLMANAVYQPPERAATIEAVDLYVPDQSGMWSLLLGELGLPADTWKADGVRACDSLIRRLSFTRNGVMKESSRKVSPIADWTKGEVMERIERAGIRLPIDYELFGRSFDGIDRRFTEPMREWLPEDYERLRAWFPLLVTDLIRKGVPPDGF